MDKLLLLNKPLRKMMDGSLFTLVFGWIIRIAAFLMALAFILVSIQSWRILGYNANFGTVIYCVLAQAVLAAVFYALFNLLWLKGSDILGLSKDADYCATPIYVVFIKTLGESLFIFILGASVLAALGIWLGAGVGFLGMVPFLGEILYELGNRFVAGLVSLLIGPIVAVALLLFSYFLAEMIGAIVSIAKNTKR